MTDHPAAPDLSAKPVLIGERVRLEPLGPEHVDDLLGMVTDPALDRLTGTHTTFTREQLVAWCGSRAEQDDRLDLAVVDPVGGEFLGDLAVNDWDPDNLVAGLRIALWKRHGRGLGSEALRLVLDHLFDVVGAHRVGLEVVEYNERAVAAYRKVGFREEGRLRQAWLWDGERYDVIVMGVLSTDRQTGARAVGAGR
ncbi:GNAT family N-acetyltransferase [Actinokineospora spheciospongiae]|uniref:GNAT family N-acetyltransferase n=1 Tax=Actinokineospora spheciospongiae TaxID=909613 RepID=UPI000D911B87|nr:GNAT family protein [Actinokineospora spheciospongiae]PWW62391.1 RimJ/RimL family protein N-acetyltransferase [Actinokineospora spheciospongiae]